MSLKVALIHTPTLMQVALTIITYYETLWLELCLVFHHAYQYVDSLICTAVVDGVLKILKCLEKHLRNFSHH